MFMNKMFQGSSPGGLHADSEHEDFPQVMPSEFKTVEEGVDGFESANLKD